MSKRTIKNVTVIGSGIMGSGIACHLANIGVEVLLLDIAPKTLTDKEQDHGLSLGDPSVKNRIVRSSFENAKKTKPSPLYHKSFDSRVHLGNLEDDLPKIKNSDWIIEVVVERLDIKQQVFEQIEQYRSPGTIISSNTSGIPIADMSHGRSEDFQKHFCGTHFFNPPRYLKLLELIPGPKTDPEILDFLVNYGDKFLGKTTIVTKDTPAFIGNRVGIFGIQSLFHQVLDLGLSVEEVDKLTGPVIGRPKSATFRTVDVVGLDTLAHVADGIYKNCPNDEAHHLFKPVSFVETMLKNNWLGSKSGQGFYKKVVDSAGKKVIHALNLKTLEYAPAKKVKFDTLEKTKSIDHVADRYPILISGTDKAGDFYRANFGAMFHYAAQRIPEISEKLFAIDLAMKAGFGWMHGPFEIWDFIGLNQGIQLIEDLGLKPAEWVVEMAQTQNSFYTTQDSKKLFYDQNQKDYQYIPGQETLIVLDQINKEHIVFQNSGVVVHDLGDGILNCAFKSKMNSIGGDVLAGLNTAIDLTEKSYEGLIVGNQGANFSVGANIGMIFMMAVEQEYDELNAAIKYFQDTVMRLRYSSIPTVVAPHGMTLGGGCELTLHADRVVAAAESYIGLVEFGVGVIPGGGGSKELTLRASDGYGKNDVKLNRLQEYFLTIGMAKVATSAHEAYDFDFLQPGKDIVVVNKDRQIAVAKQTALMMAEIGYTQPQQRRDIKVLGQQALGMFLVGTDAMQAGHFISEHDKKIANKLAYVMAGGDLSEPTLVSEQYLLDLEREAFLSLCGERKTLERLQQMIRTGKPLRN